MVKLPHWVDYKGAEHTSVVIARSFRGRSDSWGKLIATAQTVLSAYTDVSFSDLPESYEFSDWEDVMCAARILDVAATEHGVSDPENRKNLGVLAACAFGMSGTFVSAGAVINNHRLLYVGLNPCELTAIALSSPSLAREVIRLLPSQTVYRECVESVVSYLLDGQTVHLDGARDALMRAAVEAGVGWDGYLLRLSQVSLGHISRLSVSAVLGDYRSVFPRGYVDNLIDDSPVFLPPQYEAVKRQGILGTNGNLIVALPAGTGKTLLGEMALLSSLENRPGLVCYLVPYIALGSQVADKIERHLSSADVLVHRLFGGYKDPVPLDPDSRLEVVVATPERFDALLRVNKGLLSSIRCVVVDEAHMVGSGPRGVLLEGILTRLLLASGRGACSTRLVLLSAVLGSFDTLAQWIGTVPNGTVRGDWTPSAGRLLRWSEGGDFQLYAGHDPLRDTPDELLGVGRLAWPQLGFRGSKNIWANRQDKTRSFENVSYLAESEYNRYKQPVLCVCSSRAGTRELADLVARRFTPLEPLPESLLAIVRMVEEKYHYLRPLLNALRGGVSYHNSTLPKDVRLAVERAVQEKDMRVVASTTTLAEGVDLPFRVTIVADWLAFEGDRQRPMDTLLFKNISGRCGRAGHFTEGDTVIYDNPVGDSSLTAPARRLVLQDDIFFSQSTPLVSSSIVSVDQKRAVSAVSSCLLAAVSENPDVEDLASSFYENSFAYYSTRGSEATSGAKERVRLAYEEVIDSSDGRPLAQVASPARLTPLGEAVNVTGFCPATAKKIMNEMDGLSGLDSSLDSLVKAGVILIKALGTVDEQDNRDLRKALGNPKSLPVVRLDELSGLLERWLAGEPKDVIFAELPSKQRSRRNPSVAVWLSEGSHKWSGDFDSFCDFMDSCIERFLPWVFNACRVISEVDGRLSGIPWSDWSGFVEYGVNSVWGKRLIEDELVADRAVACRIGHGLDDFGEGILTRSSVLRAIGDDLVDHQRIVDFVLGWRSEN